MQQLKSSFKRTINWNKYQSKETIERHNQYLDYPVDPSFQGTDRHLVLSFFENAERISYKWNFSSTVEIKD